MPSRASRRPAFFLWLLLLLTLSVSSPAVLAQNDALPPTVAAALKNAGIASRNVAVFVQDVAGAPPILRHNAGQAMNPASVMKLMTTYAALDLLGPVHTWKTEALVDSALLDGRLDGSLYLRGSGDPRLLMESFWQLLRQLRARGLAEISGDLVLDRSAFSLPPHDPAEFDGKPLRPYNVGPDALLVNLGSLDLKLIPDPARKTVAVLLETPAEGALVVNRLQLTDDNCGEWRDKFKVSVAGERLELQGAYPAACGEKSYYLSPWPANEQIERLFRALWRELGGSLRGKLRDGVAPADAVVLATQESPPLAEIVREINKYSNNVMARQLFLSLAAERPATPAGARQRLLNWLAEKSWPTPGLVLDNGSGLSRRERITAETLGQLLLDAWNSPSMPELVSSLPLAGVDGTLKKRLGRSTAGGRAHLKTGYLEGVRGIAGYLLDADGKRWIVVFLINDPKAMAGKPAMDALLDWLARGRGGKPTP